MKPPVNRLKPITIDMGVMLRGTNVGVAEQFLHHAQIRSTRQKMRGETVPQGMRASLGIEPGSRDIFLDEDPEHLARQGPSAPADKNPGNVSARSHQARPLIL